jgi:hypothetical protein
LLAVAVFCALNLWPSSAEATVITIEIEAVVDSVRDEGGYLEGKIKPGDIILGFYVYESTTPDSSPLDPVQGNYWNYAPPAGIALTAGGFDFMSDPFNIAFHVGIRNNVPQDIYVIGSSNNLPLPDGTPVESIYWQLNDATASVFSTDALPTTVPSLGEWQTNHLRLETLRMFSIDAHVTSAIPEPCTILLFGLWGLMFVRRNKKIR